MEFRDLKTQYELLKKDIDKEIQKVLNDTNFIMGKQVIELEEDLARYVGVKHCITCGNGTDALKMALMAMDIKKGDAVFVPDFTFFASGEVISFIGATPIFVDVYKDTFNISVEKLEASINKVIKEGILKPKAIMAVDLFGLPADFENIKKIADKYKLLIIEDGAQGFGGMIGNKRACSFGDISTTSFFPAKPLGCYGDGGAIFTDNDYYASYLKSIRIHGKGSNKYDNVRIGLNSRLDTLQAAILKVKFKAFKEYELDKVNEIAKIYNDNLKEVILVPIIHDNFYSSWAQYTIKLKNKEERDSIQALLKEKDIPSMIYYLKPMHKQKAFLYLNNEEENYKNTNELCDTVLSLPMSPYLRDEDIKLIIGTILMKVK